MGKVRVLGVRGSRTQDRGLWKTVSRLWEHQKRVKVSMHEKPYWMEQGWIQKGNVFRGKYVTRFGAWKGEIVDRAGEFDIFIFKPPKIVRRNAHGECFRRRSSTKFWLHLTKHPKGVSSAIFNVQQMIEESYSF